MKDIGGFFLLPIVMFLTSFQIISITEGAILAAIFLLVLKLFQ